MKFGQQFEFHKIPEWFEDYLSYKRLKQLLQKYSHRVKAGQAYKLKGAYIFGQAKYPRRLDRKLFSIGKKDAGSVSEIEADIHDLEGKTVL